MRTVYYKLLIVGVFSIFFVNIATAGAWTQAKGAGFFQLDYSFMHARNTLLNNGSLAGFRTTLSTHTVSIYGEYGFHKIVTGIIKVPFLVHNSVPNGFLSNGEKVNMTSTTSFGDIDLGAKFSLYNKNGFVLSTSLMLGIPTGKTHDNGLTSTDGEFNQLVSLEAGFAKQKWWVSANIGINNRTKGFSEEFRFETEFGIKLFKDQFLVGTKLLGNISLQNGTPNNDSFISPLGYIAYEYKKKLGFVLQASSSISTSTSAMIPTYSFNIYYKLAAKKNKKIKK